MMLFIKFGMESLARDFVLQRGMKKWAQTCGKLEKFDSHTSVTIIQHMSKELPKARIARRAKEAARIHKLAASLFEASFKIPSYTGKSRIIDRIKKIETHLLVLADNLKFDSLD
jgi:hypothetical protein